MAWARVDDGWWSHPKVLGLTMAERGAYVTALSWAAQQGTNEIPHVFLEMVGIDAEVDALIDAGLMEYSALGRLLIVSQAQDGRV